MRIYSVPIEISFDLKVLFFGTIFLDAQYVYI